MNLIVGEILLEVKNMKCLTVSFKYILACFLVFNMTIQNVSFAADHNDPNAVNSIFSDIAIQAADL